MFFKQLAATQSSLSYFFGCAGHDRAMAVDVVAGDEDCEAKSAGAAIAQVIPRPAGMEAMVGFKLGLAD